MDTTLRLTPLLRPPRRRFEVVCGCARDWGMRCPVNAATPADPDGRPVTLAPLEGWARTAAGLWVCPRCTRHQPRKDPT